MPATYTYNDAIDHAVSVVTKEFESAQPDQKMMAIFVTMVNRLLDLKRPTRRKRKRTPGE
jgi:hypothetical protein